jgi:hypothetical protein
MNVQQNLIGNDHLSRALIDTAGQVDRVDTPGQVGSSRAAGRISIHCTLHRVFSN